MSDTNRPTPLTDANAFDVYESHKEKTTDGLCTDADFARSLETMCAELAEVARTKAVYCIERTTALEKWEAMRKGGLK